MKTYLGIKVENYNSNKIISTQATAEGIANVQQDLIEDNYSLVIYDS